MVNAQNGSEGPARSVTKIGVAVTSCGWGSRSSMTTEEVNAECAVVRRKAPSKSEVWTDWWFGRGVTVMSGVTEIPLSEVVVIF